MHLVHAAPVAFRCIFRELMLMVNTLSLNDEFIAAATLYRRWLLLTQPSLCMVCYTASKQIGVLLRQREFAYMHWWLGPLPASPQCPSSPPEVTAALFAAVALTTTLRWDLFYSLRQQLNGLRRVLLLLLPPGFVQVRPRCLLNLTLVC